VRCAHYILLRSGVKCRSELRRHQCHKPVYSACSIGASVPRRTSAYVLQKYSGLEPRRAARVALTGVTVSGFRCFSGEVTYNLADRQLTVLTGSNELDTGTQCLPHHQCFVWSCGTLTLRQLQRILLQGVILCCWQALASVLGRCGTLGPTLAVNSTLLCLRGSLHCHGCTRQGGVRRITATSTGFELAN
jgi:hypothetical protein